MNVRADDQARGSMTLTVRGLTCAYGEAEVLHEVSLDLAPGEVLCLLGRNGAGKTTTLKAIMGLVRSGAGSIRLNGAELTRLHAYQIPRLGVAYVPQGRGLFPSLTVEENLRMGLLVKRSGPETCERIFALFPALKERLGQRAGTLSGGEQQMVATARALCTNPTYLLMDEPTEGLMPLLVDRLLETITLLKNRGVGILLVEQKIEAAFKVADRVALIETGRIRYQGAAGDVVRNPELLLKYLGVKR